jgi:hypothetical protein
MLTYDLKLNNRSYNYAAVRALSIPNTALEVSRIAASLFPTAGMAMNNAIELAKSRAPDLLTNVHIVDIIRRALPSFGKGNGVVQASRVTLPKASPIPGVRATRDFERGEIVAFYSGFITAISRTTFIKVQTHTITDEFGRWIIDARLPETGGFEPIDTVKAEETRKGRGALGFANTAALGAFQRKLARIQNNVQFTQLPVEALGKDEDEMHTFFEDALYKPLKPLSSLLVLIFGVALVPIKAGEEIFAEYGTGYDKLPTEEEEDSTSSSEGSSVSDGPEGRAS